MVNFTKVSVIATAVFVLFALAVVPAAAVWNLNFTVAYPNGTGVNWANVSVYLEAPPNPANLNGTFNAAVNQTNSSSLANITIATDSATALYSLRVIADGTNRPNSFTTYINPMLPAMTKAAWLSFLEGRTLRLVPALNIYMIAFNDTVGGNWTYAWPNGTYGAMNGTTLSGDALSNTAANGSTSLWDIFSTNNLTGFTNNIRYNFSTAHNGTALKNNTQGTSFAYVIIDKVRGVPVVYSRSGNNATNKTFYVTSIFSQENRTLPLGVGLQPGQVGLEVLPLDRNYTIILYSLTGESPPRSVDIINPASNSSINLTARSLASPTYVVGVTMNFTTSYVNVSGYIFTPGNGTNGNAPVINITNLTAIPYISNEFAPVAAYHRLIGVSGAGAYVAWRLEHAPTINRSISGRVYTSYYYNISLPAGMSWLVLASGGNKTPMEYPWTASHIGITNITVNTTVVDYMQGINFTMRPVYSPTRVDSNFTGNGSNSLPVNATQTLLQVVSGTSNATVAGLSFLDIELKTNNTQAKSQIITTRFIVETDAQGLAAFPFFVNESATVRVYSARYAPREFLLTTANLAANASINLTMTEFRPSRPGPAGAEHRGTVSGAGLEDVRFQIMGSNATCDTITSLSTAGCVLQSGSTIRDINPFLGQLYGNRISLRLKTSNGINIHFRSVDMVASGMPDMSSDIQPQELSSTAHANRVFRLGSFAPKNYQEVLVGIPYSTEASQDNSIDDGEDVNLTIPVLYDQNWNVVWNVSVNGTPLQSSAAFNSTGFGDWNISMISNGTDGAGGVICSNETGTFGNACLLNKTEKMIWIRLPHFTGGGLGLRGANVQGGGTAATASGGSSGGAGGAGLAAGEGQTSQSAILSTITANTEAKTEFTAPAVAVSEISFTPDTNLNNVKVTVEKIAEAPAGVSSPSGTVYKLLEIKASGLTNAQLAADAKVTFNVDKSWLTENNVEKGTVRLLRYTGTWDTLPTAYVSESDTQATYKATTPGFSTFAISGDKSATPMPSVGGVPTSSGTAAAGQQPSAQAAGGGEQQAGGPSIPANTMMWIAIFVVVVIVVAVGIAMKNKKRRW